MQNFYVWVLISGVMPGLVPLLDAAPKLKKEGDSCQLQNGQKGICRKFSECPKALRDFDTDRFVLERCNTRASPICCDTLTIAQRKCREYSKWLDLPTLILKSSNEKIPGICRISIEPTIIGGTKAADLEFPHMAHLGLEINSEVAYGCGASLISEQFLLTAAHCLSYDGIPLSLAKLGTGGTRSQKIMKIAKAFPHPDYDPKLQYNDIALVQLEKPLSQFTDYMRPACLQTEKDNLTATQAFASGWGLTAHKGSPSDDLLKVTLPLLNHSYCSEFYSNSSNREIPRGLDENTMICAGGRGINKDTCRGDSGGPLQIVKRDPTCMYSIIGVTAFGIECGTFPGVYTKVSHYIPWIESIVWPENK